MKEYKKGFDFYYLLSLKVYKIGYLKNMQLNFDKETLKFSDI